MKLVYTIFFKNCKLFFNGNLKKTAEAPVFLLPCHYESLDAVLPVPFCSKPGCYGIVTDHRYIT